MKITATVLGSLLIAEMAMAFNLPAPAFPPSSTASLTRALPHMSSSSLLSSSVLSQTRKYGPRDGALRAGLLSTSFSPSLLPSSSSPSPSLLPSSPRRRSSSLATLNMRQGGGTGNAITFFGSFLKTRAVPLLGCLVVISLLSWLFWKAANILMNMLGYALSQCMIALCARFPLPFCFWIVPTWIAPTLAGILVASFIIPILGYVPTLIDQAATPVYEVEKKGVGGNAKVEVRSYLEFMIAETPAYGESIAKKMSFGFAKLVKFITGENKDPITGKSVHVGMSGLLVLRNLQDGQLTSAAFSLPEKRIPTPNDPDITITTIPPQRYAVVTYTGSLPSDLVLAEYEAEVRGALTEEGIEPSGPAIIAQVMSQLQTEVMIPIGAPPSPLPPSPSPASSSDPSPPPASS